MLEELLLGEDGKTLEFKENTQYLDEHQKVSAKQAQKIWGVTARTATTRLKQMRAAGILVDLSTSAYDPRKAFVLARK